MEILTNEFIKENQNFIYGIIHKHFRDYQNINDLYQEGMVGLALASKTYNPDMNTKFTSFAYFSVLGQMRKYVRENKGIKLSTSEQKLSYKLEKVKILLLQKYGREPTIKELSLYLGISEEKVAEILQIPKEIESLDKTIAGDSKDVNLYDYVSNDEYYDQLDLLALKEEVSKLSDEEKALLKARYTKDMTQMETAKALGMSQVQVSRFEKKVLVKLKNRLQV